MTPTVRAFIDRMHPIALDIEASTGIKPAILITQAAHESRWGQSDLTVKANNLFGFTGDSWAKLGKPVIYMNTKEFIRGKFITVQRPFRAYKDWGESAADWARLMQTKNYAAALPHARTGNMDEFAKAVSAAGYATDPAYATKLVGLLPRIAEGLA